MNKNATIAIVVIALAVLGGIIYFSNKNASAPAPVDATVVNTLPETNTPPDTQPAPEVSYAGYPIAVTSAMVFPTDTTAIVNGSVNPNGALTNYFYEYGLSSSFGYQTQLNIIGSGFVTIGAPGYITGLASDTMYYYRLVAQNQYGRVLGTQYSVQTTHGNPPPVGSASVAKTISSSSVAKTSANLNGQVTPNKSSTQYWFEYGKTANFGYATSFSAAGAGTNAVNAAVSISNLDPVTTYYFRLNAQNQFGTVNGSTLSFKTSGPAAPSTPTVLTKSASNIGSTSARLNGTVNPNGDSATYWFEYSTDSVLGGLLSVATTKKSIGSGTSEVSASTDISGLKSKTTYYFRVIGQNNLGTPQGENMSFKTK